MEEYLGGCIISGDIGTWAPQVWDKLIEIYNPKTFIDIGCGAGHSLKYFIDKKIKGIGVEGYLPAINNSMVKSSIIIHDYTLSEYIPNEKIDIAWCCEFVEHVEEEYVPNFMKTFEECNIAVITHGVPGQPGFHHVNCQEAKYWIDKFEKSGFIYLEELSLQLRELLPYFRHDNGNFYDINGEIGKFDNGINCFLPNGAHVKNTLMVFEKIKNN
jgi:hypothetical protein